MRSIRWLHISDIHLTVRAVWSQDVVLRAMHEHIEQERRAGSAVDFVLITGDLAFSGKKEEYALAHKFLDALSEASGVPRDLIFCIPGNHDVDRDRQTLAFVGGRSFLQSQNHVDTLLAPSDDLKTLLERQRGYRRFHETYFSAQRRTWTSDGLAYVSRVTVGDVRFAIIGLNSAWLAEGGDTDHGNLLVGEHQVIEAIRLVQDDDDRPHVIVGMVHHPLHLLREFDRVPVLNRLERVCHFLHCGHLHEPETRPGGLGGNGCLTLTAGASFLTRHSDNSHSLIELDLIQATRTVTTVRYKSATGRFVPENPAQYPIELATSGQCGIAELAGALRRFSPSLAPWAHFLAAVLLDHKAELPILTNTGHAFGTIAVVAQTDGVLREPTIAFVKFANILRVLYGTMPLDDVLSRYGDSVARYGAILEDVCDRDHGLRQRLEQQEHDVRVLIETKPGPAGTHTQALLAELAESADWAALREFASRHLDSATPGVATHARRMLALALAHSDNPTERIVALDLYRSLLESESAEPSDAGNFVTLLFEHAQPEQAKAMLLTALERFSVSSVDYFHQLGRQIVGAGGDREFRNQLEAAVEQRRKRG